MRTLQIKNSTFSSQTPCQLAGLAPLALALLGGIESVPAQVPNPPVVIRASAAPNDGITLTLSTGPDQNVVIQSAASLTPPAIWTTMMLMPVSSSPLTFNIDSGFSAVRFYQATDASGKIFSVNVVGFVRRLIQTGTNLVANPLQNADNLINTILPNCPEGSQFMKINAWGQEERSEFAEGMWRSNTGETSTQTLAPGEGAILVNPSSPFQVTFIGEVPQGELSNRIPAGGRVLRSSMAPLAGLWNFPAKEGDIIQSWNISRGTYLSHLYMSGEWSPPLFLNLSDAFWIQVSEPVNWLQPFQVNGGSASVEMPRITSQPLSCTNEAGTTTSFTTIAAGTPPLAYQWFFNSNTLLAGATNSTLVLTNVQGIHGGSYSVVVSNTGGSVTSHVAMLKVLNPAPTFSLADYNYPLLGGSQWIYNSHQAADTWTTLVRVEAVDLPLTFYTGRNPVSTYQRLVNALVYDQGDGAWTNYMGSIDGWGYLGTHHDGGQPSMRFDPGFIFTNRMSFGQTVSVTSDIYADGAYAGQGSFSVRLMDQADIIVPAGSFDNCLHLAINYTLGGKTRVEEQWWAKGIGPVKWTHGDPVGSSLEVNQLVSFSTMAPPLITNPPKDWTGEAGAKATFDVVASGAGSLGYQWLKDGVGLADSGRISGATGATLAISQVQIDDAGSYTVIITNAYGSVTSSAVGLTIASNVPLRFALNPVAAHGEFRAQLTGPTNLSVIIQSSLNLTDWTVLSTNTIPGGSLPLNWPTGTYRLQFFRARLGP